MVFDTAELALFAVAGTGKHSLIARGRVRLSWLAC